MAVTSRQYSHCSFCGAAFKEDAGWPRCCQRCGQTTYRNPLPVSVVLQPVAEGLLAVRRTINPGEGRLALPGGFIEVPETWQEAAARELWEETGVSTAPDSLQLFQVHSARDGTLLIFGLAPSLVTDELPAFSPSEESGERVVLTEAVELAFSLHTRVVEEYFAAIRDATRS